MQHGVSAPCVFCLLISSCVVSTKASAGCDPIYSTELHAPDGGPNDTFGFALSIEGDTLAVSAVDDDDAGLDAGAVNVFIRDASGDWMLQQKIVADDAAAGDVFGRSLALSGDTLAIGVPEDDDNGADSGSAYIFVRERGVWAQQAKLLAEDGAAFAAFGTTIALSGDFVIVGAPEHDARGAAYIFARDEFDNWSQESKLLAFDAAPGDRFGGAVGISGERAVIGAFDNVVSGVDSGSAYVFGRVEINPRVFSWMQQQQLVPSDAEDGDIFGRSISMEGDRVAIGAPFEGPFNTGAVYLFERHEIGLWFQQAKLIAWDPQTQHWLGSSVDLTGDLLIAGGAGAFEHESAVVFARHQSASGMTSWRQVEELIPDDLAPLDLFGRAVAIDNESALVSRYWNDDLGVNSGSVAEFTLYSFGQGLADCNDNDAPDCMDIEFGVSSDCNNNGIPDECDIALAFSDDCNVNGLPDECEAFGDTYSIDDGVGETDTGLSGGGEIAWLNQFTVVEPMQTVVAVEVAWTPVLPAGTPATIMVYDDPNNDGNPNDAQLLTSVTTTSEDIGEDVFSSIAVPETVVGTMDESYFIGVFVQHGVGQNPARKDNSTQLENRSWLAARTSPGIDIEDLFGTSPTFGTTETIGVPGTWLLRAVTVETLDDDGDGVPDECRDPSLPGDLDDDGDVDFADLLALLAAWGACDAECTQDLNDSGDVGFADLLILLANWS